MNFLKRLGNSMLLIIIVFVCVCPVVSASVHRIFQERILEWVAISYSRRSSCPRNRTGVSCVSCIAGRFFTAQHLLDIGTLYA